MVSVIKRDKELQKFDEKKLLKAISRAIVGAREGEGGYASKVVSKIVTELKDQEEITWSKLNELVEQLLVKDGYVESAKMFLLHRVYKLWAEKQGTSLFDIDPRDLDFTYNALKVCEKRYFRRDGTGIIRETPTEMFRRVAHAIASMETRYGVTVEEAKLVEDQFFKSFMLREFFPNSPTLMNAGLKIGQLSACFVLPVGDSIEEIYNAAKYAALIHKTGGGTGFSFSCLRPRGDVVGSTGGVSSGPVSFMKLFDAGTEVIKQGGRRRGANMGMLRIDHPDVLEFITAKDPDNHILRNFNISLAVTDKFIKALEEDGEYELLNPRSGEVVKKLNARSVFEKIINQAWKTGDPGMVFIDRINVHHPAKHLGLIEATNPCGEQPLMPYESCNLASINLSKMVVDAEIDWDRLRETTLLATRFLDNVIDANRYPIQELDTMARKTRKIGLGIMGFSDMLIQLGVQYDSDDAMKAGRSVMNFISYWSHYQSVQLARERGSFPAFKGSDYGRGLLPVELDGFRSENIPSLGVDWDYLRGEIKKGTRNLTNTTIAPTGTISILAGCSSGIEPIFAIAFRRIVLEGTTLLDVHPLFEKITKEMGIYGKDLMELVAETGSIAHMNLPEELKRVFRTTHDIAPEWHVRVQGEFQRYTDNAVSKTINLPQSATPDDVAEAYIAAYNFGCKGITVYRDRSKSQQVIYFGLNEKVKNVAKDVVELANLHVKRPPQVEPKSPLVGFKIEKPKVIVDSDYSGGCKDCDL